MFAIIIFGVALGGLTIALCLLMNRRIESLDRRIDYMEQRVDYEERRIDFAESSLNSQLDVLENSLNSQLDVLESALSSELDALESSLGRIRRAGSAGGYRVAGSIRYHSSSRYWRSGRPGSRVWRKRSVTR